MITHSKKVAHKKTLRQIAMMIALFVSLRTYAGHFVGNGGDYIRGTYIQVGQVILNHLQETESGAAIVTKNQLSMAELELTLDIQKINVTEKDLIDNTGSLVDAIGVPGLVTLQSESWFEHFEKERDVYYLVFHEMLRSAGVNDDNYRISQAINPFPFSRRIETKVTPLLPLISDDNLSSVFDLNNVNMGGSGCAINSRIRVEFDQEKNILEIHPTQFQVQVTAARSFDVKSCQLAIPVQVPAGQQLVISQMDLSGRINLVKDTPANVSYEAFLAGTKADRKNRLFSAVEKMQGRFLVRRTEVLKSKCGGQDILRVNSGINIKGVSLPEATAAPYLQMNSMSFYLSLEKCSR
jgi:hypothetical protein